MISGLCVSLQCGCLTLLQVKLQVKDTSGQWDRGKFYQHALLHLAVLHYTLPPLPLYLLLIIRILLLFLILLLLLLLKEV